MYIYIHMLNHIVSLSTDHTDQDNMGCMEMSGEVSGLRTVKWKNIFLLYVMCLPQIRDIFVG